MPVSDTQRHASPAVTFEDYPVPGYNYRMSDIQAALGRSQALTLTGDAKNRHRTVPAWLSTLTLSPPAAGVHATGSKGPRTSPGTGGSRRVP